MLVHPTMLVQCKAWHAANQAFRRCVICLCCDLGPQSTKATANYSFNHASEQISENHVTDHHEYPLNLQAIVCVPVLRNCRPRNQPRLIEIALDPILKTPNSTIVCRSTLHSRGLLHILVVYIKHKEHRKERHNHQPTAKNLCQGIASNLHCCVDNFTVGQKEVVPTPPCQQKVHPALGSKSTDHSNQTNQPVNKVIL